MTPINDSCNTSPECFAAIYVEHYTLVACFGILLAEIVFGSVGNLILCHAVYKNKNLRTPINALVVNVGACGIVVSVSSAPLLLATLLAAATSSPEAVYTAQKFIHITCATVQLVTIVAISYERHQAIARPFDKLERVKRAKVCIPVSWCLGLLCALLATFVLPDYLLHHLIMQQGAHLPLHRSFETIILVPLSLASIASITALYIVIIFLVQKHIKEKQLRLFGKPKNKVAPASTQETVPHSVSTSTKPTVERHEPYKAGMDFLQVPSARRADLTTHGDVSVQLAGGDCAQSKSCLESKCAIEQDVRTTHVVDIYSMDGSKVQANTSDNVSGAICVMSPANKERGKRRVEAKAAKVTAFVISCFLLCWSPYPVSVLVVYLTPQEHINLKLNVYMVCLCLSLLAAALNPIMYGVMNKTIRSEVKKQSKKLKEKILQCLQCGNNES